jgi:pimeloyl-ACP methyl ester carboxylesterase
MHPIATDILTAWNARSQSSKTTKGLIAVSFDQRNHGTRLVDKLHNEAWRQGNSRHAQDMFSCLNGTATDTSHLIGHIESYIFTEANAPNITQHLVLGVSLGGHAAWHCVLSDPRITAAVVGIGCPDYTRLMADRARLSRRETYTASEPPGTSFIGSVDFPRALVEQVALYDPAGLLLPGYFNPVEKDKDVGRADLERMGGLVKERLQGKRVLNLSGREDKLVPYAAGEPFLKVFKQVLEDPQVDVEFEDVLFDGVGHAFPPAMKEKAKEWVCALLAKDERPVSSKI